MAPSTSSAAQLYSAFSKYTGTPTATTMPRVCGASACNSASARACRLGMKNVSSQPYPVIASSGRHSSVTPAARASVMARSRRARLPSQSSGVWLTTATPTLMSCMVEAAS